ncbi:MAG: hypothetical protein JXA25_03930 [Anaerolineales bacterium]|nr:hypothetical protein [Anaerolineales bacterium]
MKMPLAKKNPMCTHLHFGVRVGQRADFPGMGKWRWQAGWIKPCPQELGWLQPSLVIISQDMQFGDRYQSTAGFLTKWWLDILFTGIYILGGICMFIVAKKQEKPVVLIVTGVLLIGAGWTFIRKGMLMLVLAALVGFQDIVESVWLGLHYRGRPESFELWSDHVNDTFTIDVYLPRDYEPGTAYPAIYVLDGDNDGRPGGQIEPGSIAEYDEAILQAIQDEEKPDDLVIVSGMDFGPTEPFLILPYGVKVDVNSDQKEVRLVENAVVTSNLRLIIR